VLAVAQRLDPVDKHRQDTHGVLVRPGERRPVGNDLRVENDHVGEVVRRSVARIAIPQICVGVIDKRRQDNVRCTLRSDTLAYFRVRAQSAEDTWTAGANHWAGAPGSETNAHVEDPPRFETLAGATNRRLHQNQRPQDTARPAPRLNTSTHEGNYGRGGSPC
jgi:hypothetical protein